jgi:hypothetical protein
VGCPQPPAGPPKLPRRFAARDCARFAGAPPLRGREMWGVRLASDGDRGCAVRSATAWLAPARGGGSLGSARQLPAKPPKLPRRLAAGGLWSVATPRDARGVVHAAPHRAALRASRRRQLAGGGARHSPAGPPELSPPLRGANVFPLRGCSAASRRVVGALANSGGSRGVVPFAPRRRGSPPASRRRDLRGALNPRRGPRSCPRRFAARLRARCAARNGRRLCGAQQPPPASGFGAGQPRARSPTEAPGRRPLRGTPRTGYTAMAAACRAGTRNRRSSVPAPPPGRRRAPTAARP